MSTTSDYHDDFAIKRSYALIWKEFFMKKENGIIEEMGEVTTISDSYNTPRYSAAMIKDLRKRLNLTQSGLASVLNTSASSVQQWERGAKNPGGTSCKLLHLLDRKGLEILL